MKNVSLIICLLISVAVCAQTLPANRYYARKDVLSISNEAASFGYSLRKLRNTYTGFAIEIRRSTDNATANVSFDTTDIVSTASTISITSVGTSSFKTGDNMTLATFSSGIIYVTKWYDQGPLAYDAIQTNTNCQPQLQLNIASPTKSVPAIFFEGNANAALTDYLIINQPIENIVNNGINGTFLLSIKPTTNTNQNSFGTWLPGGWRWSFHINWSDGNVYFDSAEVCCATNRRYFNNNAGDLNTFKQYTFVRGTTYKTARKNTITTALNNSPQAATGNTGGNFYLGWTFGAHAPGFYGHINEVIMFKNDLSAGELLLIEQNQMEYWGL